MSRREDAKVELPLTFNVGCAGEMHKVTVTPDLKLVVHNHDVITFAAFRAFGAGKPPRCIEIWEKWQRGVQLGVLELVPPPKELLAIAWAGDPDLRGYIAYNWMGLPISVRFDLLMASTAKWIRKTRMHDYRMGSALRGIKEPTQ